MKDDDTLVNLENCKLEENSFKKSKQIFLDALTYLRIQKTPITNALILSDRKSKENVINTNHSIAVNDNIDNNISQYSITQANFSIEEHAANIPINRNVRGCNSYLFKNPVHKKNFTHANIPYLSRTKTSMHTLCDDLKGDKNNSQDEVLKNGYVNNDPFHNENQKIKGSTTYLSKKSQSNMKYVSFEEFQNFNNSHGNPSKGDDSISKIMKSFNDYDINDLDMIKDIYLDNSKGSILTRKLEPVDFKNFKVFDFGKANCMKSRSFKSGQSVCSMPFKFNQSNNNSKINCSKILVVDSKNISLNIEEVNKLSERDISFRGNDSKNNICFNIESFHKTGSIIEKNEESYDMCETVSKKIHKSRISRIKSKESRSNTNNPGTDEKYFETNRKMSFKNVNFVSENKSYESKNKNSFQLSNILNRMKFNFDTINESRSEKEINNSRKINRNLLDNFNELDSNQDLITPTLNTKRDSLIDENNYFTPRDKIRKPFNDPFTFNSSLNKYHKSSRSLKTLDESIPLYSTVYDLEFVNNLLKQDEEKIINPDYLIDHPLLKSEYRSILINWLIELSEEFAFKRDTLHYATRYIDIYLSNTKNFSNTKLQLLGIVALSLAAKIEEIQIPKTEDYLLATEKTFSVSDFIQFEKEFLIVKSLFKKIIKWKLIPSNINLWLNWYLCQWDVYLDSFEEVRDKFFLFSGKNTLVYFKKPDEETYFIFRQISQLIDIIILDINYLNFSLRELVAACLYIIIGKTLNIFDKPGELNDMTYLLKVTKNNYFADIFSEFLHQSFGFNMQSIYLAIIFVSKFMKLNFSNELPLIAQTNEDIVNYGHYEDFLSFQAYNPDNYFFISNYLNK